MDTSIDAGIKGTFRVDLVFPSTVLMMDEQSNAKKR